MKEETYEKSPRITVIEYGENFYEEFKIERPEELHHYKDKTNTVWINIEGLENEDALKEIALNFSLHPLTIEYIINRAQRPKLETFKDYIFIAAKMIYFDNKKLVVEHLSLLLGRGFLMSFQEKRRDLFEPVRKRLREKKGGLKGSDYLAYCLLDAVVDGYFEVLEKLGERIEFMEEELVRTPSRGLLNSIHKIKKQLILMRRAVWPLREVAGDFERLDSPLVKESTRVYLRDLYDHIVQVIETIESYREMISGMLDIYLSSINNRMNEIMKVLTIIGTIFLPLSFITGIYGMNFVFMPELYWKWGYFATLGVMLFIAILMLLYFKRKKWL